MCSARLSTWEVPRKQVLSSSTVLSEEVTKTASFLLDTGALSSSSLLLGTETTSCLLGGSRSLIVYVSVHSRAGTDPENRPFRSLRDKETK